MRTFIIFLPFLQPEPIFGMEIFALLLQNQVTTSQFNTFFGHVVISVIYFQEMLVNTDYVRSTPKDISDLGSKADIFVRSGSHLSP